VTINHIYAVRVTAGQEYNVALIMETRARANKLPVRSILVVDGIKGFVFIEAPSSIYIDNLIAGIRFVKGRVGGILKIEELENFIAPKPIIEEVSVNDIVEIIGGPFRGLRGKVVSVDRSRGEVTIELFEAAYPLPTTVSVDYVRIVERGR